MLRHPFGAATTAVVAFLSAIVAATVAATVALAVVQAATIARSRTTVGAIVS